MFKKGMTEDKHPAKEGLNHWRLQRITAIALIPLTVWFVVSVATLPSASYTETIEWISNPAIAILITFFSITSLYHASLGVQVIIEDYIHTETPNKFALIGSKIIFTTLGAIALIAIGTIVF